MDIVEEIKQKVDVVELLSSYLKLQKAGKSYRALCPFHPEKTPSFFVFPEQQRWHCFGACGVGGDIFSFVMKREGMDFGQALRFLADKIGIVVEHPTARNPEQEKYEEILFKVNEDAAVYYHRLLTDLRVGTKAREYIDKRGISTEILERFQLGCCSPEYENLCKYLLNKGYSKQDLISSGLALKRDDGSIYDRFRDRLVFPISNVQGRILGFGARALDDSLPKYMNSPQTSVFDKSNCLYAIDKAKDAIRQTNSVIIVEGYMDALTSHQYGWTNTVASMGTALSDKHLTILKKYTKNLVLALDSDVAGEEATLRIAELTSIENYINSDVKVVTASEGKDPDEEIKKSPELWKNALANAKLLIDYVIGIIVNKYDLSTANSKIAAAEKIVPVIQKINDPIRRGEYLIKIANTLNIQTSIFLDFVNKNKQEDKKRKTAKAKLQFPEMPGSTNDRLETGCLKMLILYPEMKPEGRKIPPEYFENSVNLEIFLKWCTSESIDDLRSNLDPIILTYMDHLLRDYHLPMADYNEEKKLRSLKDCVDNLQARYLKAKELKKSLILEGIRGSKEQVAELDEQGISESEQIKDNTLRRQKRRQIAV